jgi:type I restriction-modification system DNA methylase subunit
MAASYADAKIEVEGLVERFARLSARNRKRYNEPATRQEFVLPLFRALGWNVEDTREVSPEERVSRGFVDFAFRIGGIPRFFLETKKIPENLEDPRWAQQAINYAWLKGVTWAVLTDFEGLKVFNAEWQETLPARAIFKDLHWEEYLDRFDDLWLLSRPAMEEGALDGAAEAVGRKVKKTPVNRQLFADLTEWRSELFRYLRPYNPQWSIEQIDQAVQRILDRLIFIRTCEDREIEPPLLRPLLRQWHEQDRRGDLVAELNRLFREFDATYDTHLFAPHFCEELKSEPASFEMVIQGLHDVPGGYGFYDFNAIDADVLGTIYEQYLGHRAQDPEGKQVVDKRAKRKAQGIYYTPQFVVRYIVGQTLGRLLQERDYGQARQVKVLDPACGSGSFLIEAFDVLDRYLAGVRRQNAASAAGDIHDLARRMEILTGNLYGVDLDAQAVEIARLNLLLKAVNQRGELPRLDNIRQGNSLISGTSEELEAAFGSNWRDKHPFNWEEEFPQIMERGGFDVIVGNPPYVRAESLGQEFKAYTQSEFSTYASQADLYVYFIEQAHRLLKPDGYFGVIVSNKFVRSNYGKALREFLATKTTLLELIDFGELPVFQDAAAMPVIIITQNRPTQTQRFLYAPIKRLDFDLLNQEVQRQGTQLDERALRGADWTLATDREQAIIDKMRQVGVALSEYADAKVLRGVITGLTEAFVIDCATRDRLIAQDAKSAELIKPFVVGDDVRKYHINFRDRYLIRIPKGWTREKSKNARNAWGWFERHYPAIAKHLKPFEAAAEKRQDKGEYWWELRECAYYDEFEKPKIVYPDIAKESRVAFDTSGLYLANTIYFIPTDDLYLLALLNSKLIFSYFKRAAAVLGDPDKGGRLRWFRQDVLKLPIRRINFGDPADVARHDRMVALVEEMLRLQKEHAQAEALKEDRRHDLARRIERLDTEIDALVYELYGLTEEEIKIVEETT